jgi:hypothetical protein
VRERRKGLRWKRALYSRFEVPEKIFVSQVKSFGIWSMLSSFDAHHPSPPNFQKIGHLVLVLYCIKVPGTLEER